MSPSTPRRAILVAVAGLLLAVLLGWRLLREPEPPSGRNPSDQKREPDEALVGSALNAAAASVTAAPAPAARADPTAVPAASASLDEGELMLLLRSARGNDWKLAADLAREGNRRFPNSMDAPERASILIHALAEQGLSSEARGEAEDMVNRYPDSTWVREIEGFTGAHRHRNVRVDEQGQLRYVDPPARR